MGTLILARHSITDASAAGRNLGQRTDPPLQRLAQEIESELAPLLVKRLRDPPGNGAVVSEAKDERAFAFKRS